MDRDLYYGSYLRLEKLLDAQELESTRAGSTVHDEMLFIVVHQAYELWFKQILWELDEVRRIFGQGIVDEADMGSAVSLLRRIAEIQKLLIQQVSVLETMTPLDFLDFRDYLFPASGFQSAQFRLVENRLGLRSGDRMKLGGAVYTSRFNPDDMTAVAASESEPSVFDLVEGWLERTPFLDHKDFSFWDAFQKAVKQRLEADRDVVETNPRLTAEEKTNQLKDFESTMEQYEALFDPAKHAEQQAAGKRRLSHRAFQAALFITLYRDQPALAGALPAARASHGHRRGIHLVALPARPDGPANDRAAYRHRRVGRSQVPGEISGAKPDLRRPLQPLHLPHSQSRSTAIT